jgi:hypothetical protein
MTAPPARRGRRTAHPVLSPDQLNRATLARQLLLERASADRPVEGIVESVGGLQAQEPASPYIALWSRLDGFESASLDRMLTGRRLVKATLMRATVHVVSRRDYLRLWPAVQPMLTALTRRERGGAPGIERLQALAEAASTFAWTPRSITELRDHVGGLTDGLDRDDAWWMVRRHAALVHAPSSVPWSFGRRPRLVAAATWLGGDRFADEAAAIEHLVRRHLAAFGPATAADVGSWSGLSVGRLQAGIEAIERTGDLRRFSDERGRMLLDLEGAPLPPANTEARPRLLPMWDSVLLAFADRTRIISDEHRRIVIARNGDTLPTFLVDGRVAGLWWAELDGGRSRVVLEPFARLARDARRALEQEAERLAAFVDPLEPEVYRRYRRTRARRLPSG